MVFSESHQAFIYFLVYRMVLCKEYTRELLLCEIKSTKQQKNVPYEDRYNFNFVWLNALQYLMAQRATLDIRFEIPKKTFVL